MFVSIWKIFRVYNLTKIPYNNKIKSQKLYTFPAYTYFNNYSCHLQYDQHVVNNTGLEKYDYHVKFVNSFYNNQMIYIEPEYNSTHIK